MASSCRIFVGNIPYDATEEQVKALCEEVGPVVSFRIVTDRDTGRPKGFGFCEYKDEVTALSARRNLQGCKLNGRNLRVDFAANDKANHLPIGLPTAIDAASTMAGALGSSQQSFANDPLTVYLSNMSRNQLAQMILEVKGITEQNKELAHELLLAKPQLKKALLQAQIMLGMVTPQMMKNVNIRSMPPFNKGQQPQPQPHLPQSEPIQISEPEILPPELDPALLQPVLSLPPEKLTSLSPELRQQVIQIQQMYGQDQKVIFSG